MNIHSNKRRKLLYAISILLIAVILYSSLSLVASASDKPQDTVIASRFGELFFGKKENTNSKDKLMLCPGGDVFGVRIEGAGVSVSRVLNDNGDCELKANDKIEKINGVKVLSCEQAKQLISLSKTEVKLVIIREGKRMTLSVPISEASVEPKLGVLLSDSAAGIGTVTYIDPSTGCFGGLGHGICDSESGEVLSMTRGEVTGVILGGASRGEAGKPGELRGILTHDKLGTLEINSDSGVFGKLNEGGMTKKCTCEPLEVGSRKDVKEGPAEIISTVKSGVRKSYSVEIFDIDYSSSGPKSFHIRVTDETLMALTGGIVRGMSGSPIIQDGKLVGAVTHVMVANPTEGYGIFIENMLSAAQSQTVPQAA